MTLVTTTMVVVVEPHIEATIVSEVKLIMILMESVAALVMYGCIGHAWPVMLQLCCIIHVAIVIESTVMKYRCLMGRNDSMNEYTRVSLRRYVW